MNKGKIKLRKRKTNKVRKVKEKETEKRHKKF